MNSFWAINWSSVFSKVLIVFVHWAIVAGVYKFAKDVTLPKDKTVVQITQISEKVKTYLFFAGVSVFVSFIFALTLGTHTEKSADPDEPSEIVLDWYPTDAQRWTRGAKVFLVMFPAAALGVYRGFEEERRFLFEHELRQKFGPK